MSKKHEPIDPSLSANIKQLFKSISSNELTKLIGLPIKQVTK